MLVGRMDWLAQEERVWLATAIQPVILVACLEVVK